MKRGRLAVNRQIRCVNFVETDWPASRSQKHTFAAVAGTPRIAHNHIPTCRQKSHNLIVSSTRTHYLMRGASGNGNTPSRLVASQKGEKETTEQILEYTASTERTNSYR